MNVAGAYTWLSCWKDVGHPALKDIVIDESVTMQLNMAALPETLESIAVCSAFQPLV
jgi:hypothetical protein